MKPQVKAPRDKVTGFVAVGVNPNTGEVIINLDRDRNGIGHLVFSGRQARALAKVLNKNARAALAIEAVLLGTARAKSKAKN